MAQLKPMEFSCYTSLMNSSSFEEKITLVREKMAIADTVTVLSGAGLSADSGIPTFRGAGGLWKNFRAEELATPEAFSHNPRLVWEWYDWRRGIIAGKDPNGGHFMIAEMEKDYQRFHLITQNVDGYHEKAGSTNPIELHGNIWMVRCTHCGRISFNFDVPLKLLPECSLCGGLLRPHIVWFGEALAPENIEKSYAALENSDLMFVVGTSGVVQPAASFSNIARDRGAFIVEINPEETAISEVMDISLQGKAGEILSLLMQS